MARMRFEFSSDVVYWLFILILLASTAFYATSVQLQLSEWKAAKNKLVAQPGDKVELLQAIDGDEVSVKGPHGSFVIRLLGIKSFDQKVNEPGIAEVGSAARQALAQATAGKELVVEFDEYKKDRVGRLLAYIRVDGQDIGLQLVREGYVMVYTRYGFERESEYLAAELEAQTRARRLWSNPKANIRVQALKATWRAQREND